MALTKVSRGLLSTSIVDNGNATAITIDSSENVGIGVSPEAWNTYTPLQVQLASLSGFTNGDSRLSNNAYYAGGWKYINSIPATQYLMDASNGLHTWSTAASGTADSVITWQERMRIDSSGNIGINVSSSLSQKLNMADTADVGIKMTKTGSITTTMRAVGGALAFGVDGGSGTTERMRIDSSGNVGIGRTPVTYGSFQVLDVAGATGAIQKIVHTGNNVQLQAYASSTAGVLGTATSHDLLFVTGDGERMRIDSNGKIFMNEGVPFAWTDGSLNVSADIYGDSSDNLVFRNTSAKTERMRIDASGNLLVGVTSISDATSRTYGNAFAGSGSNGNWTSWGSGNHTHSIFRNGTGIAGTITTASNLTTNYGSSSDQRLKENIADADDAGSKVDAIQVRKFDWIVDGSHQDYGMVAQELVTVAPEAVHQPEDPEEMMGVDYSKLVPMLVKEIQSLRNRVAQLEN